MAYLAKGFYEGEIVSQAFGQSKEKKTNYFEVKAKIDSKVSVTKEKTPVEAAYRNITIWLTPKNKERAEEALKALGWDGRSSLDPNDPTHLSLKGKRAVIRNGKDENESNKYGDWSVSTLKAPEPRKSDPNVALQFNAMFGVSPAATTSHEVPEGELPF